MDSYRFGAPQHLNDTDAQSAQALSLPCIDNDDGMDVDYEPVQQPASSRLEEGQAHDRNCNSELNHNLERHDTVCPQRPYSYSSDPGPSASGLDMAATRDVPPQHDHLMCSGQLAFPGLAALSGSAGVLSGPSPSVAGLAWNVGGIRPSGAPSSSCGAVGTSASPLSALSDPANVAVGEAMTLDVYRAHGAHRTATELDDNTVAGNGAAAVQFGAPQGTCAGAGVAEAAAQGESSGLETMDNDGLGAGAEVEEAERAQPVDIGFREGIEGIVVVGSAARPAAEPPQLPSPGRRDQAEVEAGAGTGAICNEAFERQVRHRGPDSADATGVEDAAPTGGQEAQAPAATAATAAESMVDDDEDSAGPNQSAAAAVAYWYDSDDVYDEPDHPFGMFHEDQYDAVVPEQDPGAHPAAPQPSEWQQQQQQQQHFQSQHPTQQYQQQRQHRNPHPSEGVHYTGAQGSRPLSSRSGGSAAAAAAGGSGSGGPSTSRPSSTFAGGSGALAGGSGGGLCLRSCAGPELVTADPWSEDEEEDADTTAEQFYSAAHPKDIQGIPWERLQFNRPTYRDTRLRQYRNYTNLLPDNDGGAYRAELAPLCSAPRRCGTAGVGGGAGAGAVRGPPFFSFVRNFRSVQSNIVHFQLRNLVWATSPNDVFVVHDNCVNHWNPAARTVTEVLNLTGSGGGGPARGPGGGSVRVPGLGRVQVSTLCVSGDLVAAGGFMGELVVKRLSGSAASHPAAPAAAAAAAAAGRGAGDAAAAAAAAARGRVGGGLFAPAAGLAPLAPGTLTQGPAGQLRGAGAAATVAGGAKAAGGGMAGSLLYCGRITSSENGITNGLEIFQHRSHGTVVMSANNDAQLRLFAAAAGEGSLRQLAAWPFEWAVNYATVKPDSHLAAVVGDDAATLLTDVHNGATVARLEGHRDFSFAAAWHPGGVLLATGNQDTTTLVWDIRRTDEPLTRLAGRMGAIRSIRFTPDGRFLAMSEPADFVHVYDVASGFQDCQEHDFFGEIAGIAFTPDSSSLFVGISDLTYASLMQLERQRCDWW